MVYIHPRPTPARHRPILLRVVFPYSVVPSHSLTLSEWPYCEYEYDSKCKWWTKKPYAPPSVSIPPIKREFKLEYEYEYKW